MPPYLSSGCSCNVSKHNFNQPTSGIMRFVFIILVFSRICMLRAFSMEYLIGYHRRMNLFLIFFSPFEEPEVAKLGFIDFVEVAYLRYSSIGLKNCFPFSSIGIRYNCILFYHWSKMCMNCISMMWHCGNHLVVIYETQNGFLKQ